MKFLFRVAPRPAGKHIDIRVYAGAEFNARGYCGALTMRPEEWEALRHYLATGDNQDTSGDVHLIEFQSEP